MIIDGLFLCVRRQQQTEHEEDLSLFEVVSLIGILYFWVPYFRRFCLPPKKLRKNSFSSKQQHSCLTLVIWIKSPFDKQQRQPQMNPDQQRFLDIDDDIFDLQSHNLSAQEENEQHEASHKDKKTGRTKQDYYSVLMLNTEDRDHITVEDVTQAYRALSKKFHPDRAVHSARQRGIITTETQAEHLRQQYELKQQLLNEAYSVLSDPVKKVQYDILGHDSNLKLLPYTDFENAAQYKQYIQEEKRYQHKRRQEMLTNGRTQMQMSVDAQSMFNPKRSSFILNPRRKINDPLLFISGSNIVNSFTTPISDRSMLRLSGFASMDDTTMKPSHSISAEYVRAIDPQREVTTASLNLTYNSKVGNHMFIASPSLKTKLSERSSLGVTWTHVLTPYSTVINMLHFVGFNMYCKSQLLNDKTLNGKFVWQQQNTSQHMSLEVSKNFEDSALAGELKTGETSSMSLQFSKELTDESDEFGQYTLNASVTASMESLEETDLEASVSVEKTLSKRSSVGFGVDVSQSSGVALKLSYTRERHQFDLPVQMTDFFDYRVALLSVIVPVTTFFSIRRFIYNPLQRRWKRQALYSQLKLDYEQTKAERERAQEAREDMLQGSMESKLREGQIDGLIIINAQYGMKVGEDKQLLEQVEKYPPFIDVTDQLQFQVRDSTLKLPEYSKSKLEGFFNPCPSSSDDLTLVVTYSFRGKKHRVQIADEEELVIPLEEDLIEGVNDDQEGESE